MIIPHIIGFIVSAIIMVRAGSIAVKQISKIAKIDHINPFITSFLLIGLVSSFPEAFISVASALKGEATLGLGTLLGGNIADLSLVIGLIGIAAGKIRIHEREFAHEFWLVGLIMLPILLGLDGLLSRVDGVVLISSCLIFLASMLQQDHVLSKITQHSKKELGKNTLIFVLSSLGVFIAANFVVKFADQLALDFEMPLLLVGITFTALVTTLPELMFSLTAIKNKLGDIALGDIFGTVIIDATLLVGLTALIAPIVVTGVNLGNIAAFTLMALSATLFFLKPGKVFTRPQGVLMVLLYIVFITTQIATSMQ